MAREIEKKCLIHMEHSFWKFFGLAMNKKRNSEIRICGSSMDDWNANIDLIGCLEFYSWRGVKNLRSKFHPNQVTFYISFFNYLTIAGTILEIFRRHHPLYGRL